MFSMASLSCSDPSSPPCVATFYLFSPIPAHTFTYVACRSFLYLAFSCTGPRLSHGNPSGNTSSMPKCSPPPTSEIHHCSVRQNNSCLVLLLTQPAEKGRSASVRQNNSCLDARMLHCILRSTWGLCLCRERRCSRW
jgi:hypothetical protein